MGARIRHLVYVAVSSADVPGGLTWKRTPGRPGNYPSAEYTFGRVYKRVHDRDTKQTHYFKLAGNDTATPAAKIDEEPTRQKQMRFNAGKDCWFIDNDARWYLVHVVSRAPNRITIRPVDGRDSERLKDWPYGSELEFPAKENNPLYARLRPLKAKRP